MINKYVHVVVDPWICLDCGVEYEPTLNTQCPSCLGNNTISNRVLDSEEYRDYAIQEYDERNNLIYSKDSNKYEEWYEYDENNKLIHYKKSDGYEIWEEYDQNNNLIYYKNSKGYEEWKEYDKNNNLIHSKDSDGYEKYY